MESLLWVGLRRLRPTQGSLAVVRLAAAVRLAAEC
jgi:hypothetical protein